MMSCSECCCDVTAPPLSTNIDFLLINKPGQSLVSLAKRNARSVHQCCSAVLLVLNFYVEKETVLARRSARWRTGHSTLYAVVAAAVNIRDLVPCLGPASPAQHRGSRMTNEMEISGAEPRQFSDSSIRLLSDMEMRCRDEELQR